MAKDGKIRWGGPRPVLTTSQWGHTYYAHPHDCTCVLHRDPRVGQYNKSSIAEHKDQLLERAADMFEILREGGTIIPAQPAVVEWLEDAKLLAEEEAGAAKLRASYRKVREDNRKAREAREEAWKAEYEARTAEIEAEKEQELKRRAEARLKRRQKTAIKSFDPLPPEGLIQ